MATIDRSGRLNIRYSGRFNSAWGATIINSSRLREATTDYGSRLSKRGTAAADNAPAAEYPPASPHSPAAGRSTARKNARRRRNRLRPAGSLLLVEDPFPLAEGEAAVGSRLRRFSSQPPFLHFRGRAPLATRTVLPGPTVSVTAPVQ